jgi:hypothetical protein
MHGVSAYIAVPARRYRQVDAVKIHPVTSVPFQSLLDTQNAATASHAIYFQLNYGGQFPSAWGRHVWWISQSIHDEAVSALRKAAYRHPSPLQAVTQVIKLISRY